MSFQLFTPLFNKIDTVTATFVTDLSQRSIIAIMPILSVSLTLTLIVYGLLVIRGVITTPIAEFLAQIIKITVVLSVALSGGIYQSQIAGTINSLPDNLVQVLTDKNSNNKTAASIIDNAAEQGFNVADKAFENAGFFAENGFLYAFIGIIISITTSLFVAIGGSILLLVKLALSILTGLGPFFIVSLLWRPTARYFELWLNQIINYIILMVLFTATFGLLVSIYSSYMQDMTIDGTQTLSYAFGGSLILSIAMIIILLQLPAIASSLAGGVSISYLSEFNSVKRGGGGAITTSKSAISGAASAGSAVVKGIARSHSNITSSLAANAFQRYYLGSARNKK